MLLTRSMITSPDFDSLRGTIEKELHNHKGKYTLQGVAFIVAGVIAAAFPASTAINVEMIVGAILLLTGALQFYLALRSKMHLWAIFSACLSIGFGLVMLWQPIPMLLAFVTLMAVFMTLEGALEVLLSLQFRPARHWKWMLSSGLITLLLAAALWIGYPLFDILYLGWIIAINLIFYGLSLLMLVGNAAQLHEAKAPEHPVIIE